jgi:hypothetical protein
MLPNMRKRMNRNILNTILGTAVVVAGVSFAGCTNDGTGGEGEGETAEGEGEEGEGEEGEGEEGEGEEGEGEEGEGEEGEGEEGEGEPANPDPANGTVGAVRTVIDEFINLALVNNVYNGWFSNGDLNPLQLKNCLVHQVSTILAVPSARYDGSATVSGLNNLYDAADETDFTCQSMTASHTGLGIPTYAYDALVADVVSAINSEIADVPTRMAVLTAVGGAVSGDAFKATIVDATQDVEATNSPYNYIGGKPSILAVLNGEDCGTDDGIQPCFVGRVLGDATLAPFFAGAVARDGGARLVTCLQRQLAEAFGGPDDYLSANGLVEGALATGAAGAVENCVNMLDSHVGLGITDAQFEALDLHAAIALDGVLRVAFVAPAPAELPAKATAVYNAAVGILTSPAICADIVEQAVGEAAACAQFDPSTDPDAPDAP